jgi:hydrogenase expression/formation protein HypC
MCHCIPAQVEKLHKSGRRATVSIGGLRKRVSIELVEGVNVGDWVIVHTGFALTKLDEVEAQKTLVLFAEADAVLALVTEEGETVDQPAFSTSPSALPQ